MSPRKEEKVNTGLSKNTVGLKIQEFPDFPSNKGPQCLLPSPPHSTTVQSWNVLLSFFPFLNLFYVSFTSCMLFPFISLSFTFTPASTPKIKQNFRGKKIKSLVMEAAE